MMFSNGDDGYYGNRMKKWLASLMLAEVLEDEKQKKSKQSAAFIQAREK